MAVELRYFDTTNDQEIYVAMYGEGGNIHLTISPQRLEEIDFTFSSGEASFSRKEITYKWDLLWFPHEYTIRAELWPYDFFVKEFEDKVMPYAEKLRDKTLTAEEAEKLYYALLKIFKNALCRDLRAMLEIREPA